MTEWRHKQVSVAVKITDGRYVGMTEAEIRESIASEVRRVTAEGVRRAKGVMGDTDQGEIN